MGAVRTLDSLPQLNNKNARMVRKQKRTKDVLSAAIVQAVAVLAVESRYNISACKWLLVVDNVVPLNQKAHVFDIELIQ